METKNKQITLLQGKALLIELPEGVSNPRIWPESPDRLYVDDPLGYDGVDQVDLPPGNWRIIGMLSEVTERDVKPLVKYISDWGYIDHGVKIQVKEMLLKTALESLESAIVAEGYYLDENPLGNRPEMDASTDDDLDDFDFPNERGRKKWDEWEDKYKKWNEAQSRVLDRSRCLLLGRED